MNPTPHRAVLAAMEQRLRADAVHGYSIGHSAAAVDREREADALAAAQQWGREREELQQQLVEQRAELTGCLSDAFQSLPACYDTPVDHYREMARRLSEDRDVLKHKARALEAERDAARQVVETIRDWTYIGLPGEHRLPADVERCDQTLRAEVRSMLRQVPAPPTPEEM